LLQATSNDSNSLDNLIERYYGVDIADEAGINQFKDLGNAFIIGATNQNNTPDNVIDDTIAAFTSSGKEGDVDFVAPGEGQPITGYGRQSGTSFAAPVATGILADMLKENPFLTYEQISEIWTDTAFDNPSISRKYEGAGSLDREAAIAAAAKTAKNPTVSTLGVRW